MLVHPLFVPDLVEPPQNACLLLSYTSRGREWRGRLLARGWFSPGGVIGVQSFPLVAEERSKGNAAMRYTVAGSEKGIIGLTKQ